MIAYLQNALPVAALFTGLGLAFAAFLAVVTAGRRAVELVASRRVTR